MNDVLKQRLVGALILVALGVVFWPIIFVEPEGRGDGLEARIPPRPDVDTAPLSPPDRVGLRGSPPLEAEAEVNGELATQVDPGRAGPAGDDAGEGAEEGVGQSAGEDAGSDAAQSVAGSAEPAAPVTRPADPGPAEATGDPEDAVAARTREAPPEQPAVDAQGVPVAWMLQVISVTRKDSAEQTRQALEDMGYKAYIKRAQVEGKTVYRVYVGPKFERARLDAIKGAVDERLGVNSMVRRYLP